MAFSWFKKKTDPPRKEDNPSPQENNRSQGPDYHTVDWQEKVKAMYQRGELSMVYLFPLVFGGEESDMNRVYVPQFAAMFKERFDNMVVDLFEQGVVTGYSARPEYKGSSFVPAALVLEAKGKGGITERIEIW